MLRSIHHLAALDSAAIATNTLKLRLLINTTPIIFNRVRVIAPVPIDTYKNTGNSAEVIKLITNIYLFLSIRELLISSTRRRIVPCSTVCQLSEGEELPVLVLDRSHYEPGTIRPAVSSK